MPTTDTTRPDALPPITEEQVARALDLHAAGQHWEAIGKSLGLSPNRIRYAADPEWARLRRQRTNARRRMENASLAGSPLHLVGRRMPADEAAAALATIPPDTRSWMAKFMGDPLPGRSALDRRGRAPC